MREIILNKASAFYFRTQNFFTDSTLPVFVIIAIWVDVQKHSTEVRVWVVNALNNFNNISCGMHFICSKKN